MQGPVTPAIPPAEENLYGIVDAWMARRPVSTVDAVVDLLQAAIVGGDLPEGMPLRQERIAQKFGISKIPLREALARLEAGGFVTTHPRRGVFVSTISTEQIEEFFQLRLSIEPDVLRYALPRMTEEDMAAAARAIETFEIADNRDLGKANWEFHRTLYAPSGRKLTLQILENLHLHVDRYVRLHMGMLDTGKHSNNEHRQLLQACRKRDADLAVRILRAHIDNVRSAIQALVASGGIRAKHET